MVRSIEDDDVTAEQYFIEVYDNSSACSYDLTDVGDYFCVYTYEDFLKAYPTEILEELLRYEQEGDDRDEDTLRGLIYMAYVDAWIEEQKLAIENGEHKIN